MNTDTKHLRIARQMHPWTRWATALAIGGAALNSHAQVAEDWARNLRLGALSAINLRADFSMQGSFTPSSIAPTAPGDLVYDDGYVRRDDTGNAGGLSSYWGYRDPSQSSGGNILFHRTDSVTTSSPSTRENNDFDFGLDLAYGGVLKLWKRTLIGWEFGFNYLPIGIKDTRPLGASLARSAFTHVAPAVVPQAPYNGGSTGIGSLIGSTATPGIGDTVNAILNGKREIDSTLYAFKLGPTLYWDLSRSVSLQAHLGGAMGLVTGDYKFQETAFTGLGASTSLSGRFSKSSLVFGGYAGTTVLWHTSDRADIYLGAQYMTLTGVTYGGGGREARLRLSQGIYLSAGISWPF